MNCCALETDRAGEGLWVCTSWASCATACPSSKVPFVWPKASRAPTLLAHPIQTVGACPPDPVLRLAALFHDVGKLTTTP